MKNRLIAGALAAITSTVSMAATPEDTIRLAVTPLLQGQPIESITLTSHAGLYEIVTPRSILYTDQTGSFILFGSTLMETRTKTNLTAQRLDELSKFKFAELPLEDAIKTVRGDGSRRLATFEDPNCGYCKKLISEFSKLDNVTIYTFLTPILSPDSSQKAKAIWCAADRSKTWNDFMGTNAPLPTTADCETPLERNLALSKKLRLTGTPALLFTSNSKTPGYLPADKIELKLGSKK